MKIASIVLIGVCTLALAEGMRLMRQTEGAAEDECCYPRPPAGRALRKQLKKCSDFPASDIWENFQEDIEACKEKRKAEREAAQAAEAASSSSTAAPSAVTDAPEPDDKENETEFDADEDDHEDSHEKEAEVTTTEKQLEQMQKGRNHHEGHKGKGKGKFAGGRGLCIKEAMEKRGWAKEGQVNFDVIKESTLKAYNESASAWIPVVQEAIANCSVPAKEPARNGKHHGCGKHNMTPEKKAWRCIVNSSILKSPTYPADNEYCVSLQAARDQCLSKEQNTVFRWCGAHRGRKQNKNKRPVQ